MSVDYKWYLDRWRIMDHPKEDLYRLKRYIQNTFFDFILTKKNNSGKAVFDVKRNIGYQNFNKVIDFKNDNFKKFHFLNTTIEDLLNFNSWNFDVKNQIKGPVKLSSRIGNNDHSDYEVKYIYELSRLHPLPILAAYSVLSDNGAYVKKIIKNWFSDNPFLKTIAWKCGNDVGIRALNLVYTRIILLDSGLNSESETKSDSSLNPASNLSSDSGFKNDSEFDSFLDKLIYLHYKFLITHPSRYSSLGNHRAGELTGLIAITSTHTFKNSDKCLKNSLSELKGLLDKLIFNDGFNKEQSTRYQSSYLNLFLFSFTLARQYRGYIIPDDVTFKLRKMFYSLSLLKVKTGNFINLGDNDNAELIYPYSDKNYNLYESLLNDYAILFNKDIDPSYHFDFRNYLLLGDKGYDDYNRLKSQNITDDKEKVSLLKDAGYFIINQYNVNLLFDVGRIGLPPAMSHGHSDILSFVLYYKELPFIVDSGTFQYNIKYKKYRDYFRSVAAHNTISVNNRDQAVKGNGMFWMTNPKVKIIDFSLCENNPFCIASHNGFCSKTKNILHKRKVAFCPKKNNIIVNDFLLQGGDVEIGNKKDTGRCAGNNPGRCDENRCDGDGNVFDATFYLNFHPDIKLELKGNCLFAENNGVRIKIENELFLESAKIYCGDKDRPQGWFAPCYDKIVPAHSLVCEMKNITEKEIITKIYLN